MKTLLILLLGLVLAGPVKAVTFQTLNSGTTHALLDVCFTDANTGYAVGILGTIIKTTNAGVSWVALNSTTTETLYSIYFLDAMTGYAVGVSGIILKTTNAGVNWSASYVGSDLNSVYFLNAQTGWVVGNFSACLKTTNGGINWVNQSIPLNNAALSKVTFNNNKGFIGVAVNSSNLLSTTNWGTNWVDNKIRTGNISSSSISFSGNVGVTVGKEDYNISGGFSFKPIIFTTSNSGQNWTESIIMNRRAILYSVSVCQTNPNVCFAAGQYANDSTYGNKGLIMYTTNGGQSWIDEVWNTDPTEFRGVVTTSTDVYIVGNDGLIVKAVLPVGIRQISSEVPDKFTLSQNYPNPFNPTTNIEFTVPKNGAVKLTVFDIAGREIAVLVNDVLKIGKYRFDFDATNLSSGTYFYRLQTADYVSTKKMVLVK